MNYSKPEYLIDVYLVGSQGRMPLHSGELSRAEFSRLDGISAEPVLKVVTSLIDTGRITKPGTYVVAITFEDRSHWFYTFEIEETTKLAVVA